MHNRARYVDDDISYVAVTEVIPRTREYRAKMYGSLVTMLRRVRRHPDSLMKDRWIRSRTGGAQKIFRDSTPQEWWDTIQVLLGKAVKYE